MSTRNYSLFRAFVITAWLAGGLVSPVAVLAADTAESIIQSVDESLKPNNSFSVLSEIDTYRDRAPSGSMTVQTYVKISRATKGPHSISVVLAPAGERGKVFLRIGDALWLHDPGADRPVKISTQQRLMGDASMADLTHFDLEANYKGVLEGEEVIADSSGQRVTTQKVTLKARSRSVLYPTLRLWASDPPNSQGKGQRKLPVKIECLSSTGSVLKTVYYSRFRGFLGMQRPTELTVVDGTAPGRVTRIRSSQFTFRNLKDEYFSPQYMNVLSTWVDSKNAPK